MRVTTFEKCVAAFLGIAVSWVPLFKMERPSMIAFMGAVLVTIYVPILLFRKPQSASNEWPGHHYSTQRYQRREKTVGELLAERKEQEAVRECCREVFAQGPIGRWRRSRFSPADSDVEWRFYPDGRAISIEDLDQDMFPSYCGGPSWSEYRWRQVSARTIEIQWVASSPIPRGDEAEDEAEEEDEEADGPSSWEELSYDFRGSVMTIGPLIFLWAPEGSAIARANFETNRFEAYLCDSEDLDEAPRSMWGLADTRPLMYVGPPSSSDGSPDSIIEELLEP